jgi:hypothetical protein
MIRDVRRIKNKSNLLVKQLALKSRRLKTRRCAKPGFEQAMGAELANESFVTMLTATKAVGQSRDRPVQKHKHNRRIWHAPYAGITLFRCEGTLSACIDNFTSSSKHPRCQNPSVHIPGEQHISFFRAKQLHKLINWQEKSS